MSYLTNKTSQHHSTLLRVLRIVSSMSAAILILDSSSALADTQSELTLEQAEQVCTENKVKQQADLSDLWTFLKTHSEQTEAFDFTSLKQNAINQLKEDKLQFQKLQPALGDGGSYPWRTSLTKLLGTPNTSGILDDTVLLLEQTHTLNQLELNRFHPKGNEKTTLKTSLIYLALATGNWSWAQQGSALRLIYPIQVPLDKDATDLIETAKKTRLITEDTEKHELTLHQPNAGFIFGGNLVDGKAQGLDASSYVSHVSGSPIRLSTWHMELIWKALKNEYNLNEDSADPVVKQIHTAFHALTSEPNEILPGDLIVKRKGNAGHVIIFKRWISHNPPTFSGYEATREDGKAKEGIRRGIFQLNTADYTTYILRKL